MVKVSKEVVEQHCQMLATSADLLSRRHGLTNVTVAEIAAHAKLTTGAVYARFGSREELLAAGIRAGFDRMLSWLETVETGSAYRAHVLKRGRMADGAFWCPAMSHVASIRTASDIEQEAFRQGLENMLRQMASWPDVKNKANALKILAGATGRLLFAGAKV